jgi:alpha-1,2-mannosyltransferase
LDISIFFLITLAYYFYKRKSWLAGIVLGFAISLKLLVAPLIFYFLWKKDWRTGVLSAITAMLLTITSFTVAGWEQLLDFIKVNYLWSVSDLLSYPFNQSVNGLGLRLFTDNPYIEPLVSLPLLASVLRAISLVLAVYLWIRLVGHEDNRNSILGFLEFGFTVSTMLFLSPLVDDIHYVWVLLPISSLLGLISLNPKNKTRFTLSMLTMLCILYLGHPDLHDAIYYGWENLVYNDQLVRQTYVLLTGAYVYGLISLEINLLAAIKYYRGRASW